MKQPIARVPMVNKKVTKLVSATYKTVFNPEFIFRKFISIRDRDDIRYFFRAARRAISRLLNK